MEYRFCPSCGGALEARNLKAGDPDRPVCTTCGFIVYVDPKVAVGTIIRVPGSETERANAARVSKASVSEQLEGTAAARRLRAPDEQLEGTAAARRPRAPNDERIVLVRRAIEPGYGLWVFPGGYVDRGEAVMDAAVREAREEAGLLVRIDSLLNIYSYPGVVPIIIVYVATRIGGELCFDDECLEVALFAEHEVPWDELAFKSTGEALREYFGARGNR